MFNRFALFHLSLLLGYVSFHPRMYTAIDCQRVASRD